MQQPAGLEHLRFLSSLHLHIFASFFSPSSSLGLEEFIPMAASAASNALTSASDLRTTLVIRQDSYLSGSPTASVPLSFYPLLFWSHSLSSLPQHNFPFILKLLACSLFNLPLLLLSYYYFWALWHQLCNFSWWSSLMKNDLAWIFSAAKQNICTSHSTVRSDLSYSHSLSL